MSNLISIHSLRFVTHRKQDNRAHQRCSHVTAEWRSHDVTSWRHDRWRLCDDIIQWRHKLLPRHQDVRCFRRLRHFEQSVFTVRLSRRQQSFRR